MNLDNLNEMQKDAVLSTEGPLLILAGAGSGKTKVITTRIAYLIEQNVAPVNILAITFTNKAAKEMKKRVQALIGDKADYIQISTFHAFCSKFLRREAKKIGYESNFTIYDTADKLSLIKTVMDTLGIDRNMISPNTVAYSISNAKNDLLSAEEYENEVISDNKLSTIAKIYKRYSQELKKNNAMDFDDLIYNTVYILKNFDDVLQKYQSRYKYIMVDEYQDTNYSQYLLVNMLSKKHKNICVVGDDDQSIYAWRGADIKNILDFEKDYDDVTVVKLEQNYRSTSNIINAAKQVIKNNGYRKDKSIWTDSSSGEKIKTAELEDDNEEAYYIASQIKYLKKEKNLRYSDFAVLYRANSLSRKYEEAFIKASIPYRIFGGLKFYDRMEIKDLLAYLKLIDNIGDDVSLKRIINVPKRSIGTKTVEKLEQYARENELSLFETLANVKQIIGAGKAQNSITSFHTMINTLRGFADILTVSELFEKVIELTNYTREYKSEDTPENKARMDNIGELTSLIAEYEKTAQEPSLRAFLQEASLSTDMDTDDRESDYVTLMTIHSAKGLEFDTVFIAAAEEGIFPSSKSNMDAIKIEEERRLFYVAITRAKRELFITRASRRMFYGKYSYNLASRFLPEIDGEFVQQVDDSKSETSFSSQNSSANPSNNSLTNYYRQKYGIKNPTAKSLKTGAKVKHEKYGSGMIVGFTGGKYSVLFDKVGIKIIPNKDDLKLI